jgi:hypothetical protein
MDYKVKHYMNQNILIKKWMEYFYFYQHHIHPKLEKNLKFFKDIMNSTNYTTTTQEYESHDINKDFEYFINVGKINGVSMLPKLYIRKVIKEKDLVNVIQFLENAKNSILQILYQLGKILKVPKLELYIGTEYDTIDIPPYNLIDYHKRYYLKILNLFDIQYLKYRLNKKIIIDFIKEPYEIDVNDKQNSIYILNLKFLLYMVFFILNVSEERDSIENIDITLKKKISQLNIEDFFLKSENIPILNNTITIIKKYIIDNLLTLYEIQTTSIVDTEYDLKTKITHMGKIITPDSLKLDQTKYEKQLDNLQLDTNRTYEFKSDIDTKDKSDYIKQLPNNHEKQILNNQVNKILNEKVNSILNKKVNEKLNEKVNKIINEKLSNNSINRKILEIGEKLAKDFPKQTSKKNDIINVQNKIKKIQNPIIQNMAQQVYK